MHFLFSETVVLGLGAVLGLVVAVMIVAVMVAAVRRTRMSQNVKLLPVPANDTVANSGEKLP